MHSPAPPEKLPQRIVVPVSNNNGLESLVFAHFGRAPYFAVLDIDSEGSVKGKLSQNPCGDSHKPGVVPRYIRRLGTNVVLARSVGVTAHRAFGQANIDCRRSNGRTVLEAAQEWLDGETVPLEADSNHQRKHRCDDDSKPAHEGCGGEHTHEGCGGEHTHEGCGGKHAHEGCGGRHAHEAAHQCHGSGNCKKERGDS